MIGNTVERLIDAKTHVWLTALIHAQLALDAFFEKSFAKDAGAAHQRRGLAAHVVKAGGGEVCCVGFRRCRHESFSCAFSGLGRSSGQGFVGPINAKGHHPLASDDGLWLSLWLRPSSAVADKQNNANDANYINLDERFNHNRAGRRRAHGRSKTCLCRLYETVEFSVHLQVHDSRSTAREVMLPLRVIALRLRSAKPAALATAR